MGALSKKISQSHDVKVEVMAADLANEPDLARVEKVLATNPGVRVLVNNAGLSRLRPIATSPVQDSLSQIALNIIAPTRLAHAVLPAFLSPNDGVIVNIASVLAITWPSVADHGLWEQYDCGPFEAIRATQTGKPAPRYIAA